MKNLKHDVPVVMTFAGNDPSGGAGIQADIEAIGNLGAHCAPVITCLTAQDTVTVDDYLLCPPDFVLQQARTTLEDIPVAVFKIGVLGSLENIEAVHTILEQYPHVPVVLDPILASGDGKKFVDDDMQDAMIRFLLPKATICTPNSLEAKTLAPEADSLDACAQQIMAHGAEYVLITGAHTHTKDVHNTLYTNYRQLETFRWERLKGSYHGSGCTLASSIAALIAQGLDPFSAIHEAQEFTLEALKTSFRIGMGQRIPNRLYRTRLTEDDMSSTPPLAVGDDTIQ